MDNIYRVLGFGLEWFKMDFFRYGVNLVGKICDIIISIGVYRIKNFKVSFNE